MLGFPILYCKGMRPMMFQLSGFCYKALSPNSKQVMRPSISISPAATGAARECWSRLELLGALVL